MKKVCFLSMDSLENYVADDDLAIEPLHKLGWEVETVSWRNTDADWNDFKAVIIRTPWDYQRDPDSFLEILETIDRSDAVLENSLSTVRWNLNKQYLKDLENAGIPIVPTEFSGAPVTEESVDLWLEKFQADELIIKPAVSATAEFTYRFGKYFRELTDVFQKREYLVQPFQQRIINEGEFSLFYFDGRYSHTIRKSPKANDFRVQEEHGGLITAVVPDENLLAAAQKALDFIAPVPLYARIDLVRDARDRFCIMELELIEPALYFRMDEGSASRFARAFHDRMQR